MEATAEQLGRQQYVGLLRHAQRVVVKVGTSTLTHANGLLNLSRMESLARHVADLSHEGRSVILVTSGAIGAGIGRLGLTARPEGMPEKQAVAAVGQGLLMQEYERLFSSFGYAVGQVLLTRDDLAQRNKHLNSRNTIEALWSYGVIPIVNENDTVAVQEIRMGDNDLLAALVAGLVSADLLLILSDVDGLYDRNPQQYADARLVSIVQEVTDEHQAVAGGPGTSFGSGGMGTKVQAARIAAASGTATVIANGAMPSVIRSVVDGEPVGTLFVPKAQKLAGRKRWIAFYQQPRGKLTVDAGAVEALVRGGKSLLPAGIVEVSGAFDEGDVVSVVDGQGVEIARGLANYNGEELARIGGKPSQEIETILGYKYLDEAIHRDNMVLSD